jgi:uncharacterized protein (DUF58 family)
MSAGRRAFAIAAGAALFVCILRAPATGARPLQFTIALSAGSYAVGRPIPLDMTLTNASPAPARVNGRLGVNDDREPAAFREVTFDIRTPSGKRASFRLDIKRGAAHAADVVSLKPHDSVKKTVDLAHYYAVHETGTYEARATYASAVPGAEHGPVTSNSIRFTVR